MSKNQRKISKILIANRGEIVRRIALTAQLMKIKVVGIYSEQEYVNGEPPFHLQFCDESYSLGSGILKDTYLNSEKIIKIAKDAGADAIHPGYGFLSENAEFAKALSHNGLIFIGPSIESIEIMGSKKISKDYVLKFGVPTIPGYQGDDQSFEKFKEEATKIGYPVLLKASAGGGGKGMRRVDVESELLDAFDGAKSEGLNSFGDDTLLIEKYLEGPRHIEFQVISDSHGGHYHLYERECSIQRRHQKIIEESPSPTLTPELRASMGECSLKLTRALNYLGAGTIEYMVDKHDQFYFLEMNTRLQVEHPVTEEVCREDLVELQIRAAEGEKLNLVQSDISQNGHAIELRLYAENPDNNFLPETGKITKLEIPLYANFRWESGVEQGSLIDVNFDPMCAKMVFWSQTRLKCIEFAKKVLKEMILLGVKTNREYLLRVLEETNFVEADITTNYLIENTDKLKSKDVSEEEKAAIICFSNLCSHSHLTQDDRLEAGELQSKTWEKLGGFRNV